VLRLKPKILPPVTLKSFLIHTKLDLKTLEYALQNKEKLYGYFRIPKKKGGFRPITPSLGKLKEVQRLAKYFMDDCINWPNYMQGGIAGRSVLTNAKRHLGKYMVVNIDIEKCFPNTTRQKVNESLNSIGFDKELSLLLTDICIYKECLPQGAPTSTMITNIVLSKIDQTFCKFSKRYRIDYSRFVDDITFSGSIDLRPFKNIFYDTIGLANYSVSKYSVADKSKPQIVTGLVVNNKINPTHKFIQQLKDDIKSGWPENATIEFVADEQGLTMKELRNNILGRISFVRSINNKLGRELRGLLVKVVWPKCDGGIRLQNIDN